MNLSEEDILLGADYHKLKTQIWWRDGNVQWTIRNVGLELRRDPEAKGIDLKVENLIKYELLEACSWKFGELGWDGEKNIWKVRETKGKTWTMENRTYFH